MHMTLLRQEERFFPSVNLKGKRIKVKASVEALIFKTVTQLTSG